MADYYCDPLAVGANNGTSWTDAYTNLQNGLWAMPAGTHRLLIRNVTSPGQIGLDSSVDPSDLTLVGAEPGVVFTGGGTGIYITTWAGSVLKVQDVTIGGSGQSIYLYNCAAKPDIELTDVVLNGPNYGIYVYESVADTGGVGDITMTGGELNTTTYYGMNLRARGIGDVTMDGVALTVTAPYPVIFVDTTAGPTTTPIGTLTVKNCTGTCLTLFRDGADHGNIGTAIENIVFEDNEITMSYAGTRPFSIGIEVTTNVYKVNSSPPDSVIIRNNKFTYAYASATHIMFLGVGITDAQVYGNLFQSSTSTTNFGIVMKGQGIHFYDNQVIHDGSNALYLAGGYDAHIHNNTVKSAAAQPWSMWTHSGYGAVGAPPEYGFPGSLELHDNIFYCSGSGLAGQFADAATYDPACHHNCYWSESGTAVVDLGTEIVNKTDDLQADWETETGSENDLASFMQDPDLSYVAGTGYVPASDSPVIGAGTGLWDMGAGASLRIAKVLPPPWIVHPDRYPDRGRARR